MVFNAIIKYENILYPGEVNFNSSLAKNDTIFLSTDPGEAKILIAMILSFTSGLILVMYILVLYLSCKILFNTNEFHSAFYQYCILGL